MNYLATPKWNYTAPCFMGGWERVQTWRIKRTPKNSTEGISRLPHSLSAGCNIFSTLPRYNKVEVVIACSSLDQVIYQLGYPEYHSLPPRKIRYIYSLDAEIYKSTKSALVYSSCRIRKTTLQKSQRGHVHQFYRRSGWQVGNSLS